MGRSHSHGKSGQARTPSKKARQAAHRKRSGPKHPPDHIEIPEGEHRYKWFPRTRKENA